MSEPFMFRLMVPVRAEQARARLVPPDPPPPLLPAFVYSRCGVPVGKIYILLMSFIPSKTARKQLSLKSYEPEGAGTV